MSRCALTCITLPGLRYGNERCAANTHTRRHADPAQQERATSNVTALSLKTPAITALTQTRWRTTMTTKIGPAAWLTVGLALASAAPAAAQQGQGGGPVAQACGEDIGKFCAGIEHGGGKVRA